MGLWSREGRLKDAACEEGAPCDEWTQDLIPSDARHLAAWSPEGRLHQDLCLRGHAGGREP